MRSDIVRINNAGEGFEKAIVQSKKVAVYEEIEGMDAIQLQVMTEEILSLVLSVTGQMNASFWIEMENGEAVLHLTTNAVLDKEKRAELISTSSSRKNEAANTFLGRLRDRFEEAMASEPDHESAPADLLADLPHGTYEQPEWDEYERSILRSIADEVKIGIQKGIVEITVTKRFGAEK